MHRSSSNADDTTSRARALRTLAAPFAALACASCFFPATVINQRSSVEQELTTYALERVLAQVDLESLPLRRSLRLRISAAEGVDREYLRALVERRLRALGITLVEAADADQLHLVVPVSGSDMATAIFGFPLGAAVQGIPSSDISIYRRDTQYGRARIQTELLDAEGALLDELPEVSEVVSITGETFLIIFGPFRSSEPDDWYYDARSTFWRRR
jgi:hypothetical protein